MKRLYLFLTVKCLCVLFLFVVVGVSCKKEDGPGKKEDGIKIENLQTRLRIAVPDSLDPNVEDLWHANTGNILVYYPPFNISYTGKPYYYKGKVFFGYMDEQGAIIECEVKNLPESVKDWKAELVYDTGFGMIREINVRMNGVVRLDTAGQAIKRGVLELTSLEPSGTGNKPTLQRGIYFSTYPHLETRLSVNFVNESDVIIPVLLPGKGEYDYAIREEKHTIVLKDPVSGKEWELFFRAVNDYEFELEHPWGGILEYPRFRILTFKHIDKLYKK
ncbi:hypothetical protein [Tannerella sp.]|uniref:hypothetical protein n=1 Tax=Tannerella sp. TaxID=2382127 RepID=UPI0026DD770C|nr:hypothetical protein [Tannerella sp.]MDO4704218.1 hypothetical protein [Tannerella sp.]